MHNQRHNFDKPITTQPNKPRDLNHTNHTGGGGDDKPNLATIGVAPFSLGFSLYLYFSLSLYFSIVILWFIAENFSF